MIYKIYSLIYGKGEDNMIANYNVELLPYASTGSFRFWCQKVLPLVYDNSLSYYELLCKVVKYLNDVIQNSDNMNANIEALNQAFINLQDYVNHYFDEFNMQQYVNAALDEMVDNGTLQNLIEPYLDRLTQTVNDAIEDQNQAIDNAIGTQNQTIDDKLDEVENVVNGFDDRVDLLESRMDALSQSYGSANMTLLFESSTPQDFDTSYNLSITKENFEFLDIYYTYEGSSDNPYGGPLTQIKNCYHKRVKSSDTYFMLDATNSPTNRLQTPIPIPQLTNACTYFKFTDDTTFKRMNGGIWNWNGNISANATRNFNSTLVNIIAIYGVRSLTETPQEITDIRVAWNGTVYPTAGGAVRAQFSDVVARITALETALTNTPSVYHGYTDSQPDAGTKNVTIVSINNQPTTFKDGDVFIIKYINGNTQDSITYDLQFGQIAAFDLAYQPAILTAGSVETYVLHNQLMYPISRLRTTDA